MTVKELTEQLYELHVHPNARVVFAVDLEPTVFTGWEISDVRLAGETVELRSGEVEG